MSVIKAEATTTCQRYLRAGDSASAAASFFNDFGSIRPNFSSTRHKRVFEFVDKTYSPTNGLQSALARLFEIKSSSTGC